jgi:hypothetical protein
MRDRIGEKGLLSDDARPEGCFREKGKEYKALNPKRRRMLRYRIDGTIIDVGRCCDFAMGLPQLDTVYFIELKGTDLKEAASQILATVTALEPKIHDYIIHGRIVLSRIQRPDLRSSHMIALERKLAQHKGSVKRECKVMTETV